MQDVALPTTRVAYVPGGALFSVTEQAHHARLNYSAQPDDRIETVIAALGKALKLILTLKLSQENDIKQK
jgi:DNA-binding transcriptional MocR family regulator